MAESMGEKIEVEEYIDNIIRLVDDFGLEEEKMGFPEGKTAVQLFQDIK